MNLWCLIFFIEIFVSINPGYANEFENINQAIKTAKNLTQESRGLMQAILAAAHNNRDQNNTAFPAKRNAQGDFYNDRDYLPKRGYGERYPDGRTASDRIYDRPVEGRGLYGDDRSYHRDLEGSRDYHKEEDLRERGSLHEDGHYNSDRYSQGGRRNHMLNDNSSLRHHNDRTHIVDEIRHDTKIYKSDERMDSDLRSRNQMRGSQYEVNERRRSNESNERKYNIDPSRMDKPLVININSECAAPSKGRFVHKFVIKPQSQPQAPCQNYPQQNPYKMTSYQSPSSYMSRQHVGSSLYGAYY